MPIIIVIIKTVFIEGSYAAVGAAAHAQFSAIRQRLAVNEHTLEILDMFLKLFIFIHFK